MAQSVNDAAGPKSTKENSPYSRYGIGDLVDNRQAGIRGMGGGATAYMDFFAVNSFNPASYSFLKVTSLDFAFEGRSRNLVMGNNATTSGTATLSYLNLGVPLGKHAGMNIGLTPMSNTYYNANDSLTVNGIGPSLFNYNGEGGIHYAYLGLSGKYKGLSIGVNGGYAFGSSRNSSIFQPIDPYDTLPLRGTEFSKYNSIGGLYWKAGLMYHASLKKEQYINIGATAALSQQINVTRDAYAIGFQYVGTGSSTLIQRDTIPQSTVVGAKGIIQMPAEYSFGVHYGKERNWDFGADIVYTDWSTFSNFGDRYGIAENAYRLSLGGELTPNPEAMKNYFSTVTYRLGFYYGKDYLNLNQTDINYFGGSAGASFPLKRNYTQFGRLHTALDVGKRGTIENALAREVFVKFTIGVSLNDIWFIKKKYD